jgi:hypothetical protein
LTKAPAETTANKEEVARTTLIINFIFGRRAKQG